MSHRTAVFKVRAALPGIGRGILDVGVDPVEDGQFVDGHLPRGVKLLLVAERRTHVAEAGAYRVFPHGILVRVERLVDRHIGLLDLRVGARLEVGMDVLRQVPAQAEAAVPQVVAGENERDGVVLHVFQIALL